MVTPGVVPGVVPGRSRRARWCAALWLVAGLGVAGAAAADGIRFDSGVARTAVVELFTSQGCSSCPPAEAHLNGYADHPGLWRRVVPLAFHVDYWDDLGWEDRFGDARHSQRQHRYARLGRLERVYTPAFVVNGQGVAPGRAPAPVPASPPRVGRLLVELRDGRVHARFEPVKPVRRPLRFNVAVLGMGQVSHIRAGERAGTRARHEFVVLAHARSTPGGTAWDIPLPSVSTPADGRFALAGWVSPASDPTPLQAAGGSVPRHRVTGARP